MARTGRPSSWGLPGRHRLSHSSKSSPRNRGIYRRQPNLGPFINPPDLKLSLGALRRPPSGILRQQQHVDEGADDESATQEPARSPAGLGC
jgi:hypothetical protein